MRVLIGCEESGKVRRAFRARGHEAFSNDLVPARDRSPYHLQIDVGAAIAMGDWDIIILHLPCTALTVAGNATYGRGMPKHYERPKAQAWSARVWNLAKATARIGCALENPVSVIWAVTGKPDYIQPHQFGHMEQKKTGILVHGLPRLVPTNDVYAEMMKLPKNQRERLHYLPPSKDRSMLRSETYQGIAEAMADQWGNLELSRTQAA